VVVQLSVMMITRFAEFAAENDAISLASMRQQFITAWCVMIFVYGIFLPNTWQRAAMVMIPIALLPYVLMQAQSAWQPEVAKLLAMDKIGATLPLPLIVAVVALVGAQSITTARREAFKARQFGQYRLLDRLGAGGMGEVYKAEHVLLKRPCAIKLIKA